MQSKLLLVAAFLILAGCASAPTNPAVPTVDSGELVAAPEAVSRANPAYPDVDRRAKVEGDVEVEVVIDEQGNVAETRVLRAPSRTLGEAVREAVTQWRFTPSQLNGRPVRVVFPVVVKMHL
ncbi:MAG TPA: TonB family protein [Thermoanaerobaculia bacterium]|nr:TonB family protein [Thermoanaerobaculia bacterium]